MSGFFLLRVIKRVFGHKRYFVFDIEQIIETHRPKIVFLENVKTLYMIKEDIQSDT